MATLVFNSIDLRDGASAIPGVLKVDTDGLSWDAASSDKKAAVQKDEVEEMCWLTMATGLQLKCTKKDGDVVRFTGSWDQEAVTNLKYHSKEHFNIDMAKAKMATKGWNWGMPVIGPTSMTFDVEGTEAFEVPLGQVTQVTENKHEVALEFTPDDGEDGEQLVEMRFFVPPTQAVEEPTEGQQLTPAQELLNKIRERADISNLERGGIAEIKQANFVVPRGKYDMEMFNSFLTLRGQSYNYKIAYTQITRLFLLPRPGQTALNFVISVDPPIRQGKTAYSHLIIQLPENDEITIGLNLSESEKKEHGAKLEEEMTGKTYVLLANILKQLSQKKMAIPKTFRSSKSDSCLRCAHKANDGMLFLLDSSFFFILEPAMHIRFAEIQSVEFDSSALWSSKAEEWQARENKSWDIMIHMNHGDIHQFMNIDQNEFEPVVHFLKGKDLKLIGDLATENTQQAAGERARTAFDEPEPDEPECEHGVDSAAAADVAWMGVDSTSRAWIQRQQVMVIHSDVLDSNPADADAKERLVEELKTRGNHAFKRSRCEGRRLLAEFWVAVKFSYSRSDGCPCAAGWRRRSCSTRTPSPCFQPTSCTATVRWSGFRCPCSPLLHAPKFSLTVAATGC